MPIQSNRETSIGSRLATDLFWSRAEFCPGASELFHRASSVVVFGSVSVGLDRPRSDLDVLVIGTERSRLKTSAIDLIAVPDRAVSNPVWLQSELASHVAKYGTWIKGTPDWKSLARVSELAVVAKRRRIEAFVDLLPSGWSRLDEVFRRKYAKKIRRETQRLLLLQSRVAIPPTRLLDDAWGSFLIGEDAIFKSLRAIARARRTAFMSDVLERIQDQLAQGSTR